MNATELWQLTELLKKYQKHTHPESAISDSITDVLLDIDHVYYVIGELKVDHIEEGAPIR